MSIYILLLYKWSKWSKWSIPLISLINLPEPVLFFILVQRPKEWSIALFNVTSVVSIAPHDLFESGAAFRSFEFDIEPRALAIYA